MFLTERGGPVRPRASLKQSLGLEKPQSSRFPSTRTCCGTRLATSSPTMGMIPERSSSIWAIKISCTRCGTPKWLRIGSRVSGRTEDRAMLLADVIVQRFGFVFYLFDAVLDHIAN